VEECLLRTRVEYMRPTQQEEGEEEEEEEEENKTCSYLE
jgi:hypothetical protein